MRRQPKRVKYRKVSKGGLQKGNVDVKLNFGKWGLASIEYSYLTARQIEAARRAIRHTLDRKGNVWTVVFPGKGITSKPTEVRMGKGTGSVSYWATIVRPGSIMFELSGVRSELAKEALISASKKRPMLTKCVSRSEYVE